MSSKAHEKWLRKMGAHPDQIKQRKAGRVKSSSLKPKVTGYYESKPLRAFPTLKKDVAEKTLDNKSLAFRIMEENRTSPRDLGGDKDYA